MEYEGLDQARMPLPAAKVASDFKYFVTHYARYRIGGKVLTMWDGTWKFSGPAVCWVTRRLLGAVLVLAAANSVPAFWRLANCTDGDAYYWSSGSPAGRRGWARKLKVMGAAVHRDHQIWLAPFAPGFDDTLTGGHVIIPRWGGATLRSECTAAAGSAPDILGLISWNEWTENTYVELSVRYRYTYLRMLKNLISPAWGAAL
jgi:hypothetical protein